MTTEHSQETKIAILEAKVDHMTAHVKELTLRVRANEKVVAAVTLLGTVVLAVIGAGYFAPKAEAKWNPNEWIHEMRDWKSRQGREPVEDSINSAIEDMEYDHGCDGSTEQEELLQLPSSDD